MKRLVLGVAATTTLLVATVGGWYVFEQFDAYQNEQVAAAAATSVTCDHGDDVLCTHLPLVVLSTEEQTVSKDTPVVGTLQIIENASPSNNHLDDKPSFSSDVAIKYRGASSYTTFDKLSYHVTLLKDGSKGADSGERDANLLGMAADSEWVLYGPFLDHTFVRNRVMYAWARELMDWAPDTRFCELVVDGEYRGIYLVVESVRNSEGRIGLTRFGLLSGQTSYIVKRDRVGTESGAISTYGNEGGYTQHEVLIVYPSDGKITDAQKTWIQNDLRRFEEALYGEDFADPQNGYAQYIDVSSFVDYYLLNEFAMIADAGYLSTYTYKNLNGKLKMAVWDFNNAFNNSPWVYYLIDEFIVADNNWFVRLIQDPAFVDAVIARWDELRAGMLSDESIVTCIDEAYASLGDAVERDAAVWGYTFVEGLLTAHDNEGNERDPADSDEAVVLLKQEALDRAAWMDDHLVDLYQRSNG